MAPTYTEFVFEEIRALGRAWASVNAPFADIEQMYEKIGELSWRRLIDQKPMWQIFEEIGVDGADYGYPKPTVPPVSGPPTDPRLIHRPRWGMNISGLLVHSAANIPETLKRFVDAGVELTDVNWLSALWPTGVDCLPFVMPPAGQPFNLFDWNSQFFERAHEIRESFNAQGIVVQGTFWEDYSWSNRRGFHGNPPQRDLRVPDANLGPWRNNLNGILLGGLYNGDIHEDDETLTTLLPTPFCRDFLAKLLPFWYPDVNPVRIANEMPEKSLHERMRDLIRSTYPGAKVVVNRQDDTPGQVDNMKVPRDYDFYEYHGSKAKKVSDLSVVWPPSKSHVPTYNAMLDDPDTHRSTITWSSDGARTSDSPTDPYDWDTLGDFFRHVGPHGLGCTVLHQSRAKMTPFPNHHMIEVDWFRSLRT